MAGRYGLEIRAAAAADAPGLAELLAEAGIAVAPRSLAERLDALRARPGVVLLAQEWGPPSGVVSAAWMRTLGRDAPVAVIDLLLVGAEVRRRGHGRLMVKAVAQAARQAGCAVLRLGVEDAQADLRAFALNAGFEPAAAGYARPLRKRG